ncbi:hypothetical protein P1P68_10970 [Streptomyces scabiei]|nr:hypothetical protein [Streptomyces scabiei]MDW8805289.1 hypothetical protein [Streptomyces scabiei]
MVRVRAVPVRPWTAGVLVVAVVAAGPETLASGELIGHEHTTSGVAK